jgi:hypothetical protein
MRKIIICLTILSCINGLFAQSNIAILERKISIKVIKQSMSRTLGLIEETANFHFSYNSNVVKGNKVVSIMAENRSVREILDQLFNHELVYQQIGTHLILQKKPIAKTTQIDASSGQPNKYNYLITGYIRNSQSGDGILGSSIYEKQTLSGTVSSDYGYYRLAVVSKSPSIYVKYTRKDYRDTLVNVKFQNNGLIEMHMSLQSIFPSELQTETDSPFVASPIITDTLNTDSNTQSVIAWTDTNSVIKKIKIEDTRVGKWFVGTVQKLNEKNIRDSFQRDWQISLLPGIGTNGVLSGLVQNRLSINLIGGYNGSLDGAEFGGFLNVLKSNMHGAQFSGFGNVVGGDVIGAQFAGFFNHNLSSMHGIQCAGFYNMNHGNVNGIQMAGFMNINTKEIEGIQGAGFMNVSRSLNGIQAAGFMNLSNRSRGTQLAGFMNASGEKSQLFQAAGFMNVANEIQGMQVAGFLNVARKVQGMQLGIINIADTVNGFMFGIFNFVRNGIHQIELSTNESNQFGLAYRSGMEKLHSITLINTQNLNSDSGTIITYGYSLGSNIKLSKHFYINAAIGSRHMTIDFRSNHLNLHNRLDLGLEYRIFKGLSIFASGSLNHLINDKNDGNYHKHFKNFGADAIWSHEARFAQKVYSGFQFGVRFL